MAKFNPVAALNASVAVVFTEAEAMALLQISQYGAQEIVKEGIGRVIQQCDYNRHAKSLESFFDSCRQSLGPVMDRISKARQLLSDGAAHEQGRS